MAGPIKHLLAMPTAATTVVLAAFSSYYLLAAPYVVGISMARYARVNGPVLHVLSLVPSGFVRKRGVLFLVDVLFAQLAPRVETAYEGMVAFFWAFRLVLGAAQAYYNVVSALLGCFGLGMILTPGPFVNTVVSETFHQHYDALARANEAYPRQGSINLLSALHLSTCQAFARLVGLQLLTEAMQLFLLPCVLPGLQSVLSLLLVCAARAALTTAVTVFNYQMDGLEPSVHVDTLLSAAFFVVYTALYLAYRNRRGAVTS